MFEEGEKIYSKRFPKKDLNVIWQEQNISDDDLRKPSVPFEEFSRHMVEDSVYVVMPNKVKERQKFIDLAKTLSSEYEIDIDIIGYSHFVKVTMYLDDATYTGNLKALFAELMVMCDSFSHFASLKEKVHDLTLILDYYTHEHYISGRKVDFM